MSHCSLRESEHDETKSVLNGPLNSQLFRPPITRDTSSQHQSSITRHRTEVILPVRSRKTEALKPLEPSQPTKPERRPLPLPPNALFEFKSASAPNSPLTRIKTFIPETQKSSVTYQLESYTKGPDSHAPRARHNSLSALQPRLSYTLPSLPNQSRPSGSISVSFTGGPGNATVTRVLRASIPGPNRPFPHPSAGISNIFSTLRSSAFDDFDEIMSYNRQMSTPVGAQGGGQDNGRKTSLQIPPRPATASPTAHSRPFMPLPTHQENPNHHPQLSRSPALPRRPNAIGIMSTVSRQDSGVSSNEQLNPNNYIDALLIYQKERHNLMAKECSRVSNELYGLRAEINQRENQLSVECMQRTPTSYTTFQSLLKVREEIRQLKIDCQCMYAEIDVYDTTDLRPAASATNVASQLNGPASPPPPIPPRPRPTYQVRNTEPAFGPLNQRVPPPAPPYRIPSNPAISPSSPGSYPGVYGPQTSIPYGPPTSIPGPQVSQVYVLGGQSVHPMPMQPMMPVMNHIYPYPNNNGHGNVVQQPPPLNQQWRCARCQFDNFPDLLKCEICDFERSSSRRPYYSVGGATGFTPS